MLDPEKLGSYSLTTRRFYPHFTHFLVGGLRLGNIPFKVAKRLQADMKLPIVWSLVNGLPSDTPRHSGNPLSVSSDSLPAKCTRHSALQLVVNLSQILKSVKPTCRKNCSGFQVNLNRSPEWQLWTKCLVTILTVFLKGAGKIGFAFFICEEI